jgi:hypothetical protein
VRVDIDPESAGGVLIDWKNEFGVLVYCFDLCIPTASLAVSI